MNLSNVFLGGVTGEHRKTMRVLLEHYRNKGIKRVFIPCTGQNTITKTALEAGFAPEQLYTSDISLFSTVLGFLYQDVPIKEAGFEFKNDEYRQWYEAQNTEIYRAAVIMFVIKVNQLRDGVFYERSFKNEMLKRRDHYLNKFAESVQINYDTFKGVHYSQMDVRDIFEDGFGIQETDLVIMNPPAYAKGYEKLFDFHADIKYDPEFSEFDFGKEWITLFYKSITMHNPVLWYTSKDIRADVDKEHIIYASETGNDKYTYMLVNIPDTLETWEHRYKVKYKKGSSDKVVHYEMLDSNHELTEKDVLTIKEINKETALYYRDLFAHRLGATVSEIYYGIFCNGKLMSSCAFNTSFLRRLQANYIFESFCFSIAHNKYENLNRLAMMMLCSGDFFRLLERGTLKNSAYVKLETFKTTCLTKYRKSKLNAGLLELKSSEKMPNGTYKLTYEQPFYMDRTFADCLKIFLTEDVRIKRSWAEANGMEIPALQQKKAAPKRQRRQRKSNKKQDKE